MTATLTPILVASTAGGFDSHYVASQIKAHQAAVTSFRREVDAGRDNDLSCDGCRS